MNNIQRMELQMRLLDRRKRLEAALNEFKESSQVTRLIQEIDSALQRMDEGSYGLCEVCHEAIEDKRIAVNPLIRYCLDHLTSDQQRALEQDLDLASRIQHQMLPDKNIRFEDWEVYYHYEAAGPVSGDYCDLVIPGNGSGDIFFFLGDVSGKGVAASILMANLHAIFRSLVSVELSASQLVERANRVFCESTMSADYATLVCGRTSKSGMVEICNAGHCSPLLIRDGKVTKIEASGFPAGIFYGGEYEGEKVQMMPGDSLLLYTDGLSEAKNRADEEYGVDRLIRLVAENHKLSPLALTELCLENLRTYLSGLTKTDDLTIMVIQRISES